MGVEDRFQVTLVESQVQNDFIFSSAMIMRNSVCLCFPCPTPACHSLTTLSSGCEQTKKQQVSE